MKWFKRMSYTRIIAISFALVIIIGSILLSLPIASATKEATPYLDSLFTATSATCVTGLVLYDTCTHWSLFGQIVILVLIQIGGLGFMSFMTLFSIFLQKKIGLHERMLLMQSSGSIRMSGIIQLIKRIFCGTFLLEGIGAVILSFCFYEEMGLKKGIYYGIFHSISAFCNAGFDLMGFRGEYTSFTAYENNPLVCFTLMALIIIGGLGFFVWSDILKFKFKINKYSLHSKIVVYTTFFLLCAGWLGYYFTEFNTNLYRLAYPGKILSSLFMSVTTRTAGFNTMDMSALSESGSILTMILMFIGGSPGSTAGGIKTTTIAVLFLTVLAQMKQNDEVTVFKKRIENHAIRHAAAIFFVYLTSVLVAVILICSIDGLQIKEALFETISAIGTVGLSQGVTPGLSPFSRVVIMILMYGGRIGALSFLLVLGEKQPEAPLSRPSEKVLIG